MDVYIINNIINLHYFIRIHIFLYRIRIYVENIFIFKLAGKQRFDLGLKLIYR